MKRRALVSAVIVLVATFAFLIGLRELARSPTVQVFGRLVARVDASERVIALTFDDGPAVEVLNEIIEVLAARRVPATFFVTGAELAAVPGAGRKLVAAGHELGNHTYSHRRMVFKSSGFVRQEVEDTDALIRASGHMGEIYFRPPFGYKLLSLPWFLMRTGRTSVTWDIEPDSYPEVAASSSAIVAHVVERVQPGSIILLHVWYASRQTSLAAVPMIIDELRRGATDSSRSVNCFGRPERIVRHHRAVAFWRVHALAGALLIPYLLWVSFASALNYAVWQLNPQNLG